MKLATYLSEKQVSDADFADLIGIDRSSVSRLRNEKQIPTKEVMLTIFEKTNGAVRPDDFYGVAA